MADTITLRTSTERDVVKIVERGPQGPAGGGGGGGSGTVTSVALAGTGLSITGSPVTTSGTITANVTYGTTAGTACQGNDGRIAYIASGKIDQRIIGFGSIGTLNMTAGDGISGSINTSDGGGDASGGSINTSGHISGSFGGGINTSAGVDLNGGSLDLSQGGGSIDTRGTGYIQFGNSGTRTTLTGTATADRAISLPDAAGTLALTSDITKTAVGLGNVANVDTTNAANISSGVLPNARVNWAAPDAIGSTTAAAGNFTTLSASGTVSGTGFSNYLASPPAIGGTSAAAGSFTTLSASTSLTLGTSGILSGGTNIIEQRNTTSAQTFRIYNTVSGAADANYERGFMRWSSNVLQIGTEKAGTGSARDLTFSHDGNTRLTINDRIRTGATNLILGSASRLEWGAATTYLEASTSASPAYFKIVTGSTDRLNFDASGIIGFGGLTSSFPALKRSSTTLQVRLADDSGYTVLDAQLRSQGTAPATSGTNGTAGDIRYDADYIYVCTAANTWKRAAIATW